MLRTTLRSHLGFRDPEAHQLFLFHPASELGDVGAGKRRWGKEARRGGLDANECDRMGGRT